MLILATEGISVFYVPAMCWIHGRKITKYLQIVKYLHSKCVHNSQGIHSSDEHIGLKWSEACISHGE